MFVLCKPPYNIKSTVAAPSAGSQTAQGEAVGFETEATAIMDTMAYIRPEIYTLVGGQGGAHAGGVAHCHSSSTFCGFWMYKKAWLFGGALYYTPACPDTATSPPTPPAPQS
jgi:hypothetical protein